MMKLVHLISFIFVATSMEDQNATYYIHQNASIPKEMWENINSFMENQNEETANALFTSLCDYSFSIIPEGAISFVLNLLSLLSEHVNVERKWKYSRTPLMYAAFLDANEAIVNLIHRDENVLNAADTSGWTALHFAAQFRSVTACEILLNKGAEVNAQTKNGYTALMLAAWNRYDEIVELLLKHDAEVRVRNKHGKTALNYAKGQICKDLLQDAEKQNEIHEKTNAINLEVIKEAIPEEMRHNLECFREEPGEPTANALYDSTCDFLKLDIPEQSLLLVEGILSAISEYVDVNKRNEFQETPLMIVTKFGANEAAAKLIDRGGKEALRAVDEKGWTVLHFLAHFGSHLVCEVLLENITELDVKCQGGQTAIMLAAKEGHLEIFEPLLEKGADVNITDEAGKTALDYAGENLQKCADLIEKHSKK